MKKKKKVNDKREKNLPAQREPSVIFPRLLSSIVTAYSLPLSLQSQLRLKQEFLFIVYTHIEVHDLGFKTENTRSKKAIHFRLQRVHV